MAEKLLELFWKENELIGLIILQLFLCGGVGRKQGKVVVITGAGGVLCQDMVRAFAKAGAKVAALNRSVEKVNLLAEECQKYGYLVKPYQVNVLDRTGLEQVHERILKELGPCDILINGAGGNHPMATTDNEYQHEALEGEKSFFDLDPSGADQIFRLNFQGTMLPTQIFARDMVEKKQGCILNISSMNAYTPLTKIPVYSAAKAGISNFTQWLAVHFAGSGIRCNAIAPGFIASKQNHSLLFDEQGHLTKRSEKILAKTPMGRFVKSEELLGGVLFLCDESKASAITGVVLPIDAGFLAYSGV